MLTEPVSLWIMLYFTVLGTTMVLLFTESRFPRWQTILIAYTLMALQMGAEAMVYHVFGLEALVRVYSLMVHLPQMALFIYLSRNRGWQMVFHLLSAILFCFLIQQGAALVYAVSGGSLWTLTLTYAVLTAAVFLFLLRFLIPLARAVFRQVHQGWWLMCLLLAGHYAITIYLIPGYAGVSRLATVIKPALSLLMVGVYAVCLYLLNSLSRELEAQHEATVSALRLSGLQKRLVAVREAEETIRMERHDLRHRLQAAQALVRQGRPQEALAFLDDAQERLDEAGPVHWCRPPVLDAVFASYFDQARRQEVRVDAEIVLPEQLPVDEGELAIVFANALENGINACAQLPVERRQLRCKVICRPGLMFEVANPCAAPVRLDDRGLPVSGRAGHGLGTPSIAAFCAKYGALYRYEMAEGWITLRVVL